MLNWIIDRLAEVLAMPEVILSANSVSARKPSRGSEVPGIAVSLLIEQTKGSGVRRYIRTVEWREEVTASRYSGVMTLDVYTNTFEQTDELCRKVQTRFTASQTLLREKGFLALQPLRLDPAENVLLTPTSGSPFPVWQQKLAYRFTFEAEEREALSEGGPIQRIDVDMNGRIAESLSIPQ
jgi:hypothetical protein